jgi:2-iminobutanoate/2-iminopropanoate deaminase
MAKVVVQTDKAPKSFTSYSQAIKSNGFVFVSGQGPFLPETGVIVGESIQEQTAQCLRNIEAILQAAGSSLDKAVSATIIFAEDTDFAGINEEWDKWFPKDPPARQGAKLPVRPKGMKISIALVAEA